MWNYVESIVVLVVIGVAAAWLACRAKKTLSGEEGCGGCGSEKDCAASSLDSLSCDRNDSDQDA